MSDFKVGDKIEVVKAGISFGDYKNGDVLTVRGIEDNGNILADGVEVFLFEREVKLYTPAPDLITIDRAELPEVVESADGRDLLSGRNTFGLYLDAAGHRKMALSQLAVAEFLEAREAQAAEEEADAANKQVLLTSRRDIKARDIAKRSGWSRPDTATYANQQCEVQAAIDILIERDDAAE